MFVFIFFFNDTATTEIYTLSLHDALPIYRAFVLIRHVADEAEILTLATDPAHRRQGLARTVLTTAQSAAQQAEIRSIFLEVAEDNTAACALYRQAGYHQVGRRPGYYMPKDGAAIAALVLRKELHAI